jgi:hypothetical protein
MSDPIFRLHNEYSKKHVVRNSSAIPEQLWVSIEYPEMFL